MGLEPPLYSLTQQVLSFLSSTEFKEITIEHHAPHNRAIYDLIWLWKNKSPYIGGRVIGIAPLTSKNEERFHIYISDIAETFEHAQWSEALSIKEFNKMKDEFLAHCFHQ